MDDDSLDSDSDNMLASRNGDAVGYGGPGQGPPPPPPPPPAANQPDWMWACFETMTANYVLLAAENVRINALLKN